MKSIFITAFLLSSLSTAAFAGWKTSRQQIHKSTTAIEVQLNDSTVLCSRADYSGDFLKILIPQLAGLTVMDHRNFGAGAPCVAAGQCQDGNMPADVLGASTRPSDVVPVTITLTRVASGNDEEPECHVMLEEAIEIPIRGKTFHHVRFAEIGPRILADCGL